MTTSHGKLISDMTGELAADGQPARTVLLRNKHGMQVLLMDIGATWLSCILPVDGRDREVLLGTSSMAEYLQQEVYMGATVGRYANRIAEGRYLCDGLTYQLSVNQAGNCLHGGPEGFDKRRWQTTSQSEEQVTFELNSSDGDQGFPGNLTVRVSYRLSEQNSLEISYEGQCDRPTPINMTNHAYFNLQGDLAAEAIEEQKSQMLAHQLQIDADCYLPTDASGIPLGDLQSVVNTSFDFRQMKQLNRDFLSDHQQQQAKGYDHAFLLNSTPVTTDWQERAAATAVSPDKKVALHLYSTKPAMQLYTGNWLAGAPNRLGAHYGDYAGFALETQFLPDSPNHVDWPQPSCILRPGQVYRHTTRYQFTLA